MMLVRYVCTMAAIQIKGTASSVFPGRLCTLCGLWCMADSAPHTPRLALIHHDWP